MKDRTPLVDPALFSSDSDEWETPDSLFDTLNQLYGPFALDPAATPENAKCPRFYTKKDDGLALTWANPTFVNPPYSQIEKWVYKAWHECFCFGNRVVLLVPARTDTRWWHNYVPEASGVLFLKGRVRFKRSPDPTLFPPAGGLPRKGSRAPFPSAVVVFDSKGGKQKIIWWSTNID